MSFIETPNQDKKVMIYDSDVDITIAAGEHPHTRNELFRATDAYGNTVMRPVANIRQHGLSKLQLGVSTPSGAECRWYRRGSDGTLTAHCIPTEEEVRREAAIQALGEGADVELVKATAALLPRSYMNRQLFHRQTGRVLSENLPDISDELLTSLEPEEVGDLLAAMVQGGFEEKAAEIAIRLGLEDATGLEVIVAKLLSQRQEFEAPEMHEELPLWGISMSPELKTAVTNQFKVRVDDLRGPAPIEMPTWGIPTSVYEAWRTGEKSYEGFLNVLRTEGTPLTCSLLATMIAQEFGVERPKLRKRGEAEATYKVVENLIMEQYKLQDQAYMKWVNGGDPITRSLNLGDHVQAVCDGTSGLTARPRPTIMDGPLSDNALGDFEAEVLKADLARSSTPRDTMVPMAGLSPFWAESCWQANEDGTFSGHPAGFWLERFISAITAERDESFVGGGQTVTEIARFMVRRDHPGLESSQNETTGVEVEYLHLQDGTWRIMEWCQDGTAKAVRVTHTAMPWATVTMTEDDRAVICGDREVGETLSFWSPVGYLAFKAKYAKVPAVQFNDEGLPVVRWVYLWEQFPKVIDFMDWATEEYDSGAENVDDEVRDALMGIAAELSQVQNNTLRLLAEVNAEANGEEFLHLLAEATRLVGENPTIVTSREFEGNNGPTSLWGLLNESLIAGLKEGVVILPQPQQVVGTDLYTGDNVWGTNWDMVIQAMGYRIPTGSYQPGEVGLRRIVMEQVNRTNPGNPEGQRVLFGTGENGETLRKLEKRSLTPWAELGNSGNGILGDLLASWWASSIGWTVPCGVNLGGLFPSQFAEFTGCTANEASVAIKRMRMMAKIPQYRKMSVEKVLDIVLPMLAPTASGYLERITNRMCVMSRSPALTYKLIAVALAAIEPVAVASARAQILSSANQIGTETTQEVLGILA